jgi:hypothetical protein
MSTVKREADQPIGLQFIMFKERPEPYYAPAHPKLGQRNEPEGSWVIRGLQAWTSLILKTTWRQKTAGEKPMWRRIAIKI